jgi:uncharacterized membrane protein
LTAHVTAPADGLKSLARARIATVATAAVLAACVAAAGLSSGRWPTNVAWTLGMLLPIAATLPGLLRGSRRTCVWATLCVAPYLVYGATEIVANPAVRVAAAAVLFASLAWFVALITYLRVSRGVAPATQDSAGA